MKFFIVIFSCFAMFSANAKSFNFDMDKNQYISKDWAVGFYGVKGNPLWSVEKSHSAPSKDHILVQRGQGAYIWNVYNEMTTKNGFIEAKINILSGKEDPEAGVVWRHIDGKNYYYVRANAIEKNIIFYRMNQGKKEMVKVADAKIDFNHWYKIRVNFTDEQIEVLVDNKPLINIKDHVNTGKGKVGLFTTADTVSAFDDIAFESN